MPTSAVGSTCSTEGGRPRRRHRDVDVLIVLSSSLSVTSQLDLWVQSNALLPDFVRWWTQR